MMLGTVYMTPAYPGSFAEEEPQLGDSMSPDLTRL